MSKETGNKYTVDSQYLIDKLSLIFNIILKEKILK